MPKNHLYDLMQQLVQESESAWHIKHYYLEDTEDHNDCTKLWQRILREKENNIRELEKMVRSHMEEQKFERVADALIEA